MDHSKYSGKRRRYLWIAVLLIVFVILLAIIVPLAVILPKRKHSKASVIVPLYIYPENNSTWAPLYNASVQSHSSPSSNMIIVGQCEMANDSISVESHPKVKFTVIVNPSSGPGPSQYPNDQYTTQIQQLNAYPNVNTVGYVRTGYATRNITSVVSEVSTYAGWASGSGDLAMHGIFFDEAPHQFSEAAVEFMRLANEAVKNADGLQGQKTVIHNPGVIPDGQFDDANTDITVVFEESYSVYQTRDKALDALPDHRSDYSFMVHSVPTMAKENLKTFVKQLSNLADFLFVTVNTENFYETFGSDWADFVDIVSTI